MPTSVRPDWMAPPTQGWKGLLTVTMSSADQVHPAHPDDTKDERLSGFELIVFGQRC